MIRDPRVSPTRRSPLRGLGRTVHVLLIGFDLYLFFSTPEKLDKCVMRLVLGRLS